MITPRISARFSSRCNLRIADDDRRRQRTGQPRRRGLAAAELAVCLPVILLLVLGTIEATDVVFLKQSLSVAAYEGGRTAVIPDATNAAVVAKCEEILADRHVQGATVRVTPADFDAIDVGEYFQVDVEAPCAGNTSLSGRIYRSRDVIGTAFFMKEF